MLMRLFTSLGVGGSCGGQLADRLGLNPVQQLTVVEPFSFDLPRYKKSRGRTALNRSL